MTTLQIHVGETVEEMAHRFIETWNRLEAGEDVMPSEHLLFDSFETMTRVLSPKRLELLRRLRANPTASVAALARDLGRDYKRVHEDVDALAAAGLIERDGGLSAPYDVIESRITM